MRFARLLILILALASPLSAETSTEDLELYQWLDTLEYPFTSETPWVSVTWPRPHVPADHSKVSGFLLHETETEVTLLTAQLLRQRVPVGVHQAEREDLAALVRARLTRIREQKNGGADFGQQLPERASLAMLARALHQRGEEGLAAEALVEARNLRADHLQQSGAANFRSHLKEDFAMTEMWRGICVFGGSETGWWVEPGTPLPAWEDLLKRMERIVRLYPDTRHYQRAQQIAEAIREVIAENEAHRPLTEFELLVTSARVKELVFQLRNQTGVQNSDPGNCDIFASRADSPAHQLLAIGYEAVPQLIEAMDDDTLSRAVDAGRTFRFSHRILTVGECAGRVLYRITSRQFQAPSYTPEDQRKAAAKAVAQAWWEPFKGKSEKEILIEEISSGTVYAPHSLLERLEKTHPEAVKEALLAGFAKARQTGTGLSYWIGPVSLLEDTRADLVLAELMRSDMPLRDRVEAAEAALRRGSAAAVPLMVTEWEKRVKTPPAEEDEWAADQLLQFLAYSGDLQAVQALATHLPELPVKDRHQIVYSLRYWCAHLKAKSPPETAKAVEALLVGRLDDLEAIPNFFLGMGKISLKAPQVRLLALWSLSELAPNRYHFDPASTPEAMEEDYRKAREAWKAQ